MLSVIHPSELNIFHSALRSRFAGDAVKDVRRHLSTPGGAIRDASLGWNDSVGIWAHFSEEPGGDNPRWLCWFGTSLCAENETMYPSIEINLAINTSYRQPSGRALRDSRGKYYLGHRGGLGGGRGGQMRCDEFSQRIQAFIREETLIGENIKEYIFNIGDLASVDFLHRLSSYVKECERLRKFARSKSRGELSPTDQDSSFNPECESSGTGCARNEYEIARLHGQVINALQKKIGSSASNGTKFKMRPDLYILNNKTKNIDVLFEAKSSSDTQSWFTAIGQLLVYGAGQNPPPVRVLVCPAERKDPNFTIALKELNVYVLLFKEINNKIEFELFDEIFKLINKSARIK